MPAECRNENDLRARMIRESRRAEAFRRPDPQCPRALFALCLRAHRRFLWAWVSSVALHVVETTFRRGFDSFRADHLTSLPHAPVAAIVAAHSETGRLMRDMADSTASPLGCT